MQRRSWRLRLKLFRQSHESRRSTLLPRLTLAITAAAVFLSAAMSGSVAGSVRNGVAPARQLHVRVGTRDGKTDRSMGPVAYRRLREELKAFGCTSSGVRIRAAVVRASGGPLRGQVIAVDPEYFTATGLRFERGTFIPGDAVLTRAAATRLFRGERAIGRTLHVDDAALVVSGVVDDLPDAAAVPQVFIDLRDESVDVIDAVAPDAAVARSVAALLPNLARTAGVLGVDEIVVAERPSGRMNADDQLRRNFRAAALVVALVMLVGSMAGFVASVLLLVRERIPEIALRRALGATRPRVAGELIAETIIFALASTTIGTVLGILVELALARIRHWPTSLPIGAAVVAVTFCVGCTLLAGTIPVIRATYLDPTAGLRGEWLFRRSAGQTKARRAHGLSIGES